MSSNIAITVLLFLLIIGFFWRYIGEKRAAIYTNKNNVELINNKLIPESFIKKGYTFECIDTKIQESNIIGKKKIILYSTLSALTFPCDSNFYDSLSNVKELALKIKTVCIIKDTTNQMNYYLCSSK